MNIYHKDCGGKLKVDLTKMVTLFSQLTVTNSGNILLTALELNKSEAVIPLKLFCPICRKDDFMDSDSEMEEILVQCENCGKGLDLEPENFFIPDSSGGVYCGECSERFDDEDNICLCVYLNHDTEVALGI